MIKKIISGIFFVGIIVFTLVFFGIKKVEGESMNPTYETSDKLLIFRDHKDLINIKRDTVITFKHDNDNYVKRVVGVPGDVAKINADKLYINDSEICQAVTINGIGELTIPNDCYLVIGDNYNNSIDSRTFGLITRDDITGIVLCKLF